MTEGAPTLLNRIVKSTAEVLTTAASTTTSTLSSTQTTLSSTEGISTTTKSPFFETNNIIHKFEEILSAPTLAPENHAAEINDDSGENVITTTAKSALAGILSIFTTTSAPHTNDHPASSLLNSIADLRHNYTSNIERDIEPIESIFPESLIASSTLTPNSTSCGRVNIMGTIVQDSAPYLYPFIIEFSLIGAVVIYVMWRHIGRYPK